MIALAMYAGSPLTGGAAAAGGGTVHVADRAIDEAPGGRRITLRNGLMTVVARVGPGGMWVERVSRRLPDGSVAKWEARASKGLGWVRVGGGEGEANGVKAGAAGKQRDAPAALTGYTVIEHGNGAVTLAAALRSRGEVIGSQWLTMTPGVSAVHSSLHVMNLGAEPVGVDYEWRLGRAVSSGSARSVLTWPSDDEGEPARPMSWAAHVTASATGSLIHAADASADARMVRLEGGEGGAAIVWAGASAPGGGGRRLGISIAAMAGLGAVDGASAACAIAGHRGDAGWSVILASSRRLVQAKLEATAGRRRYVQTINADSDRPRVLRIPLDVERLSLTVSTANGQTLMSTTLPRSVGRGAEGLPRRGAMKRGAAFDGGAGRIERIKATLARVRAGEVEAAVEAIDSADAAEGSDRQRVAGMAALLKLALLTGGGDEAGDEAGELADALLGESPGLVEAWIASGDRERAAALTRWSDSRAERARARLRGLRAGRWPWGEDAAKPEPRD